MIYLALYKGNRDGWGWQSIKARISDFAIRKVTRGIYSHCEIVVPLKSGKYECYSSSIRDGGVRVKTMPLPADKWDLIPLPDFDMDMLKIHYEATKGQGYDWLGALGVALNIKQQTDKWFCSEWCAMALGIKKPWQLSPNHLARQFKSNI